MKFVKENFIVHNEWLSYSIDHWSKPTFVARFKYQRGDRPGFISFLMKNFTVEEYFNRLDNGESPLKILESKGYVSKTIKSLCKANGFEPTLEGYNAYIAKVMRKAA